MEEATAKTEKLNAFNLLPDEVFHDILSLLNIDDLFRFGSLSKRCRLLSLTCPSLTFDSGDIVIYPRDPDAVHNSFDRYLFLRGCRKIKRLSLLWGSRDHLVDTYRALTWLHFSLRCEIEEIELKLSEDIIDFPSALYCCHSLRSFSLTLYRNLLKFPYSSCSFANLYDLYLKEVVIQDGFGEWISSCKTIKIIYLDDVYGISSINIESQSLELFSISISEDNTRTSNISVSGERVLDLSVVWFHENSSNKLLKFSTPNLKFFDWRGDFVSEITMSDAMHLDFARLCPYLPSEQVSPISCSLLGNNIASAKKFEVSGNTVKVLYEHGYLTGLSFDAQKLKVTVFEDEDFNESFFIPAIASLFTRVRNLKTLCIKGFDAEKDKKFPPFQCYGYYVRYWECQDQTFVEQLEEVELDVFNGGNELELAKFLLKHAKNLKEMIINHFASLPSHVSDRLNKFKVSCDQMASITSAKVVFNPTKPYVGASEEEE